MFGIAWAEIRDDTNTTVDWLIAGYEEGSKTDITVLSKGSGGLSACAAALPDGQAVFGGCKLQCNGRFVSFFYAGEGTSVMARGRASTCIRMVRAYVADVVGVLYEWKLVF